MAEKSSKYHNDSDTTNTEESSAHLPTQSGGGTYAHLNNLTEGIS